MRGVSQLYESRYHLIFFIGARDRRLAYAIRDLNLKYRKMTKGKVQIFVEAAVRADSRFQITPVDLPYSPLYSNNMLEIMGTGKPQKEPRPKLLINLNIDTNSFIAYIRERATNRQRRNRYGETIERVDNGFSHRSTFIAERITIDSKHVEVLVNGKPSTDFSCRVKEKADAYILHICYNKASGYTETISVPKAESIKPIYKSTGVASTLSIGGKSLAITFRGFDEWKSVRSKASAEGTAKPSVIYTSEPKVPRFHKVAKMSKVSILENVVNLTIQDSKTKENYISNNNVCKAINKDKDPIHNFNKRVDALPLDTKTEETSPSYITSTQTSPININNRYRYIIRNIRIILLLITILLICCIIGIMRVY